MKLRNLSLLFLAPLLLTACFKTREDIAKEKQEQEMQANLQQNALESGQQMEKLQSEIGRLQGKLEEMEHTRQKDLSNLNTNLSSGREGTEKQVAELRTKLEEQQKAQAAAQAALFEEIKHLKEENLELSKSSRSSGGGSAQKSGLNQSGKNDYDSGVASFNAKKYEDAASDFRAYLQAHPKAKNALGARYYLADSLYKKKSYSEAIVEFGAIHEASADSALGRKSTLRIAQSFAAMGKTKDAKAFAQILVSSAPDSEEAKKARKFLK